MALLRQYRTVDEIILSIDGLQPEKGHETLYVVRELTQKRAWFAEALISATADEVRRLIAQAKGWAEALGKPVGLWLSDRQDAFVTGIAAEFPGVPHRYCQDHFLRPPGVEPDQHPTTRQGFNQSFGLELPECLLDRSGGNTKLLGELALVDALVGAKATGQDRRPQRLMNMITKGRQESRIYLFDAVVARPTLHLIFHKPKILPLTTKSFCEI